MYEAQKREKRQNHECYSSDFWFLAKSIEEFKQGWGRQILEKIAM